MKRVVLVYIYLFIMVGVVFPQNDNDRALSTFFGFSILPHTLWGVKIEDHRDASYFTYNIDPGLFYILEFGLKHKSGIELAVSLDIDNNNIEKLSNIIGRIGFKRVSTRVSYGNLLGSAHWQGVTVPYQSPSIDIDSRYFQLDLLFNAWNIGMNTYFGLCYISYDLPVIFDTFPVKDGLSSYYNTTIAGIYDTVSFRSYGISAYGDTLNAAATNRKNGFGPWINFGTELTFGPIKISDEAMEISRKFREETEITGSNIGNSGAFMAGNYYITGGLYYVKNFNRSLIGISLGYNIWGRMIMMGLYEGESTSQTLYRHGLILKAVFSY